MKTSEKTAEEKTHFYSLLTGAVPRLDFVLHMIKVTQYLADVEHHLEFEKKKPKTSLKLLLVRELIFFFSESHSQLVKYWCFQMAADPTYSPKASVFQELGNPKLQCYYLFQQEL